MGINSLNIHIHTQRGQHLLRLSLQHQQIRTLDPQGTLQIRETFQNKLCPPRAAGQEPTAIGLKPSGINTIDRETIRGLHRGSQNRVIVYA